MGSRTKPSRWRPHVVDDVVHEPRWQASLAVIAALVLLTALPARLTVFPHWILPILEGVLLIGLLMNAPHRKQDESALLRGASILLIAVINVANLISLV